MRFVVHDQEEVIKPSWLPTSDNQENKINGPPLLAVVHLGCLFPEIAFEPSTKAYVSIAVLACSCALATHSLSLSSLLSQIHNKTNDKMTKAMEALVSKGSLPDSTDQEFQDRMTKLSKSRPAEMVSRMRGTAVDMMNALSSTIMSRSAGAASASAKVINDIAS